LRLVERGPNLPLTCLDTNVDYKLPNEQIKQMLLETVAEVYSPEQVFARFTWNAEHVYGNQIQGIPPIRTWAERRFLLRFSLGTFARVVRDMGIKAPYRKHFWRFVKDVLKYRLQGKVKSFLEVFLRVSPNAHHLITWGQTLLDQHQAALAMAEGVARTQPFSAPEEEETASPGEDERLSVEDSAATEGVEQARKTA